MAVHPERPLPSDHFAKKCGCKECMQLNHVFMYGLPLLQLLDLYTAKKFVVVRGSHKRYAT